MYTGSLTSLAHALYRSRAHSCFQPLVHPPSHFVRLLLFQNGSLNPYPRPRPLQHIQNGGTCNEITGECDCVPGSNTLGSLCQFFCTNNSFCHGHGACDFATSSCACDADYIGTGDQQCKFHCPPNHCNGNGACSPHTGECQCFPGFFSEFCDNKPPTVTRVVPAIANLNDNPQVVQVYGSDFAATPDLACNIAGMQTHASFLSTTQVECAVPALAPALPGLANVTVTNDGGNFSTPTINSTLYLSINSCSKLPCSEGTWLFHADTAFAAPLAEIPQGYVAFDSRIMEQVTAVTLSSTDAAGGVNVSAYLQQLQAHLNGDPLDSAVLLTIDNAFTGPVVLALTAPAQRSASGSTYTFAAQPTRAFVGPVELNFQQNDPVAFFSAGTAALPCPANASRAFVVSGSTNSYTTGVEPAWSSCVRDSCDPAPAWPTMPLYESAAALATATGSCAVPEVCPAFYERPVRHPWGQCAPPVLTRQLSSIAVTRDTNMELGVMTTNITVRDEPGFTISYSLFAANSAPAAATQLSSRNTSAGAAQSAPLSWHHVATVSALSPTFQLEDYVLPDSASSAAYWIVVPATSTRNYTSLAAFAPVVDLGGSWRGGDHGDPAATASPALGTITLDADAFGETTTLSLSARSSQGTDLSVSLSPLLARVQALATAAADADGGGADGETRGAGVVEPNTGALEAVYIGIHDDDGQVAALLVHNASFDAATLAYQLRVTPIHQTPALVSQLLPQARENLHISVQPVPELHCPSGDPSVFGWTHRVRPSCIKQTPALCLTEDVPLPQACVHHDACVAGTEPITTAVHSGGDDSSSSSSAGAAPLCVMRRPLAHVSGLSLSSPDEVPFLGAYSGVLSWTPPADTRFISEYVVFVSGAGGVGEDGIPRLGAMVPVASAAFPATSVNVTLVEGAAGLGSSSGPRTPNLTLAQVAVFPVNQLGLPYLAPGFPTTAIPDLGGRGECNLDCLEDDGALASQRDALRALGDEPLPETPGSLYGRAQWIYRNSTGFPASPLAQNGTVRFDTTGSVSGVVGVTISTLDGLGANASRLLLSAAADAPQVRMLLTTQAQDRLLFQVTSRVQGGALDADIAFAVKPIAAPTHTVAELLHDQQPVSLAFGDDQLTLGCVRGFTQSPDLACVAVPRFVSAAPSAAASSPASLSPARILRDASAWSLLNDAWPLRALRSLGQSLDGNSTGSQANETTAAVPLADVVGLCDFAQSASTGSHPGDADTGAQGAQGMLCCEAGDGRLFGLAVDAPPGFVTPDAAFDIAWFGPLQAQLPACPCDDAVLQTEGVCLTGPLCPGLMVRNAQGTCVLPDLALSLDPFSDTSASAFETVTGELSFSVTGSVAGVVGYEVWAATAAGVGDAVSSLFAFDGVDAGVSGSGLIANHQGVRIGPALDASTRQAVIALAGSDALHTHLVVVPLVAGTHHQSPVAGGGDGPFRLLAAAAHTALVDAGESALSSPPSSSGATTPPWTFSASTSVAGLPAGVLRLGSATVSAQVPVRVAVATTAAGTGEELPGLTDIVAVLHNRGQLAAGASANAGVDLAPPPLYLNVRNSASELVSLALHAVEEAGPSQATFSVTLAAPSSGQQPQAALQELAFGPPGWLRDGDAVNITFSSAPASACGVGACAAVSGDPVTGLCQATGAFVDSDGLCTPSLSSSLAEGAGVGCYANLSPVSLNGNTFCAEPEQAALFDGSAGNSLEGVVIEVLAESDGDPRLGFYAGAVEFAVSAGRGRQDASQALEAFGASVTGYGLFLEDSSGGFWPLAEQVVQGEQNAALAGRFDLSDAVRVADGLWFTVVPLHKHVGADWLSASRAAVPDANSTDPAHASRAVWRFLGGNGTGTAPPPAGYFRFSSNGSSSGISTVGEVALSRISASGADMGGLLTALGAAAVAARGSGTAAPSLRLTTHRGGRQVAFNVSALLFSSISLHAATSDSIGDGDGDGDGDEWAVFGVQADFVFAGPVSEWAVLHDVVDVEVLLATDGSQVTSDGCPLSAPVLIPGVGCARHQHHPLGVSDSAPSLSVSWVQAYSASNAAELLLGLRGQKSWLPFCV